LDRELKKRSGAVVICILVFLCAGRPALPSDRAYQTLRLQISAFGVIDISRNPGPLIVDISGKQDLLFRDAVENSTFLRYSSVVAKGQSRSITVHWGSSDAAPSGCSLFLQAMLSGGSNEGLSAGEITLSGESRILISGIRSCATGTGEDAGARLVYRLTVQDATKLEAGETRTAVAVFTLTDIS